MELKGGILKILILRHQSEHVKFLITTILSTDFDFCIFLNILHVSSE